MLSAQKISDEPASYFTGASGSVSDGTYAYYFTAQTTNGNTEAVIWRTDGTAAGTQRLGTVPASFGVESTRPHEMTIVDGRLYFLSAELESYGPELYTVAPGATSVQKVSNFLPGGDYANPRDIVALNGRIYLIGWSRTGGYELYTSDGTAAGTKLVVDLSPGNAEYNRVTDIARIGDELYIGVQRGAGYWAVYRSDGTAAGTKLVKTVSDPLYAGYPSDFVKVGGKVIFNVRRYDNVLWETDGTEAGTRSLGVPGGFDITSAGDFAVYHAEETAGDGMAEVFRTDGTAPGTQSLGGANEIPEPYFPWITALGGTVLYPGYAGQLHAVTRTGFTTVMPGGVYGLFPAAGRVYFAASYNSPFDTLTRGGVTDGTFAGTSLLEDRPSTAPEGAPVLFQQTANGIVFGLEDGFYVMPADTPALPGFSGRLFRDLDRDGVYDPGEPREDLAQRTQNLPVNPDGSYELRWAKPKTVTIGAAPVQPYVVPTTPTSRQVTLATGQRVTGVDFGFRHITIVRGSVKVDQNVNDVVEFNEPPAPGQTVFADLDGDGVVDPGEPSAVTGADGKFELSDVPAGTYLVRVAPQPGWYVSYPVAPGRQIVATDDGGVTEFPAFGVTQTPPRNYVSASLFDDTNRDGVRQEGEPLWTPGTIWADLNDDGVQDPGEPSGAATLSPSGTLLQLPGPGTYRVRYRGPAGWVGTTPPPLVTVGPGERVFGLNFGVAVPAPSGATLAGVTFRDADADGVRDADETPRSGVRVYLDQDGDFAPDAAEPSIVTDSLGRFAFTDLPAGHYSVRQAIDASTLQTTPAPGAGIEVDLAEGQQRLDLLFGARRGETADQRAIIGRMFLDEDVDGVHDADEGFLAGPRPTFYLDVDNNGQADPGEPAYTTFPDGTFRFTATPGQYKLRQAGTTDALRVSTFGADGSMPVNVPAGPGAVSIEVGAYRPSARILDAWFEAHQAPLRVRVIMADVSNPSAITSALRVTGPGGAAVTPSRVALANGTLVLEFAGGLPLGRYTLTIPGAALKGSAGVPTPPDYVFTFDNPPAPATVVDRHVFYNNSAFDYPPTFHQGDFSDPADDKAIAPDKDPLLPGGTASFRNVTSYTAGINGVVIDVAGLPGGVQLTPSDFEFRAGNTSNPAAWALAPGPVAVSSRRGAGVGGSDRVTVYWGASTVKDKWLQVTMKAGPRTGLAAPDVFYFGNLAGETGAGLTPLKVDPLDAARTRAGQGPGPAAIDNPYDFNRDGKVNALDLAAARSHQRRALALLGPAATATPSQPDLLAAYDTGVNSIDNVTSLDNASPAKALAFAVGGTVAGATVVLTSDGVEIGRAVAAGASTTVTTNGSVPLTGAEHSITAAQILPGGATSLPSAALRVTVDTAAPDAPPAPDLVTDGGVSTTDNLTRATNPVIAFGDGAPYHRIYRDGTRVGGDYLPGPEVILPGAPLADGSYKFTITAVDAAGNESAPSPPLAVTIDATAPTAVATAPAVTRAGGADYTFTVTYADVSGIDPATIGDGDVVVTGPNGFSQAAAFVSVEAAADGSSRTATYRINAPGGLWDRADDGTYTINAQGSPVADNAGNPAAGVIGTFTVAGNDLLSIDLLPESDTGVSSSDDLTKLNNASPATALKFQVVNTAPGATVTVYADGVPIGSAVAGGFVTTVTTSGAAAIADGTHTIEARQAEGGGAPGAPTPPISVTVDTVALPPPAPVPHAGDATYSVFDVAASEAGTLHLQVDVAAAKIGIPQLAVPGAGSYVLGFTPETASFLPPSATYSVGEGDGPSMYGGDLNADGYTDLVTFDYRTYKITVLLGNGNGTFRKTTSFTLLLDGFLAGLRDLTGDGKPDIVFADNSWNGTAFTYGVLVYPGRGDGTFGAALRSPAGGRILDWTAADMNDDGKLDVVVPVVIGDTGRRLDVMLGRGDGTFAPAQSYADFPGTLMRTHAADFNGDGHADVAVSLNEPNRLQVLLGNGDGTLRPGWTEPGDAGPRFSDRVSSADVNADGKLDLITADYPISFPAAGGNAGYSILLGNGDGTFRPRTLVETQFHPGTFTVVDFDRDGKLDLVSAHSIVRGNGDGTFGPAAVPSLPGVAAGGQSAALGDFDRDGRLDMAVASFGNVFVYPGKGGPLTHGTYSVRAWLEDLAGNRSANSEATDVIVP